ncbi:MAG: hypothetical protein ABIJ39_13000 [Chloroflexota bacterium]
MENRKLKIKPSYPTPTVIFFDGEGSERWRSVGSLDSDRLADALRDR